MHLDLARVVSNPLEFEGVQWDGTMDEDLAKWLGRPFSAWKYNPETGKTSIELKFSNRRKYINATDWILKTPENFILVVSATNFEKRYSVFLDPFQEPVLTSRPRRVTPAEKDIAQVEQETITIQNNTED